MNHKKLAGSTAAVAILFCVVAIPAQAAPETSSQTGSSTSSIAPRDAGLFESKIDNPHFSSTVHGNVNVHGGWKKSTTFRATRAKVTTRLSAKKWGVWVLVASSTATVAPGFGSEKWVPAARKCKAHDNHQFMGTVGVDIIGYADPPGVVQSNVVTLACSPW